VFVLYAIRCTLYAIPYPNYELRTTSYQLYTSDERQATCDEFALFWSFYVVFCTFCASLWLKRTVFRQLFNKAISMALCTKAITCDKAGFKSSFCQEHKAGKNIISVNLVILSIFSSCPSCASWLKNPFTQCNLRLINDLRLRKITYEKINLFLQNEPNFRKSQINASSYITKEYDKMDTWSIRKNEPKTNPNEPKTNPIKANKMPKRTQYEPNSKPNKANFRGKKCCSLSSFCFSRPRLTGIIGFCCLWNRFYNINMIFQLFNITAIKGRGFASLLNECQ